MSNINMLYSKEIKENKVKAFISELRRRKFHICDCNGCRSVQENIVSLSYKIANQIDRPEELTDSEHVQAIDNFAINLGSCILRPSYLLNYGRWKKDNLVNCDESNYMLFLAELICGCNDLMNDNERIHFEERIWSIRRLFLYENLYHYADDCKGSIDTLLRFHDEKTKSCQNNDLMRSTGNRRKINLTKGEHSITYWCLNWAVITHDDRVKVSDLYRNSNGDFFSFILPPPLELCNKDTLRDKQYNLEEFGADSLNDWRIQNWGTGCPPIFNENGRTLSKRHDYMTMRFDTKYNPAIGIYEELERQGYRIKGYFWEPHRGFCGSYICGTYESIDYIQDDRDIPIDIDWVFGIEKNRYFCGNTKYDLNDADTLALTVRSVINDPPIDVS